MRKFRVYNRVRKVGVTWPVAGIDIGLPSMAALGLVSAAGIALSVLGAAIGGPPLAIVIMLIGVVAVLATFIAIARLLRMGRLGEFTQLRLIADSIQHRRHRNFETPDAPGDVNDTSRSFTDSDSVYRNF
jgi:hypothetical protein